MNMVTSPDSLPDVICCQVIFVVRKNSIVYNFVFFVDDINPDNVSSSLSSDGLLTVTAPMKKLPPPNTERVVPISKTGPSSKEDKDKKVETTTA